MNKDNKRDLSGVYVTIGGKQYSLKDILLYKNYFNNFAKALMKASRKGNIKPNVYTQIKEFYESVKGYRFTSEKPPVANETKDERDLNSLISSYVQQRDAKETPMIDKLGAFLNKNITNTKENVEIKESDLTQDELYSLSKDFNNAYKEIPLSQRFKKNFKIEKKHPFKKIANIAQILSLKARVGINKGLLEKAKKKEETKDLSPTEKIELKLQTYQDKLSNLGAAKFTDVSPTKINGDVSKIDPNEMKKSIDDKINQAGNNSKPIDPNEMETAINAKIADKGESNDPKSLAKAVLDNINAKDERIKQLEGELSQSKADNKVLADEAKRYIEQTERMNNLNKLLGERSRELEDVRRELKTYELSKKGYEERIKKFEEESKKMREDYSSMEAAYQKIRLEHEEMLNMFKGVLNGSKEQTDPTIGQAK